MKHYNYLGSSQKMILDSLLHKTLHEIAYRRPYKLGSRNYVYLDINLLVNLMDRVDGTLYRILEKAYNQSMGIKEEEELV